MPSPQSVAEAFTLHAFEVEGIEKVGNDSVMEIKVLPNRAHDCLSHRGLARELGAILNLSLESAKRLNETIKGGAIEIKLCRGCPRYYAALMKGVSVGDSPEWLKERLLTVGQRPINNVVDILNYVMLSTGQPLHAFDAKIWPGKVAVEVREGQRGEKLTALDGKEYDLEGVLTISTQSGLALAIAGIRGGTEAAVSAGTTNILIESANFSPERIRRASLELSLKTDASVRFEHGLSPELVREGMDEAVSLIEELAGGEVAAVLDSYPRRPSLFRLGVSRPEIERALGLPVSECEIERIFEKLGFKFEKVSPRARIVSEALKHEGAPYKFGASVSFDAPRLFDCSSFVSYVYLAGGLQIPRVSADQLAFGEAVEEKDAGAGDLIFSDGHVGIYLGDGKIIHASGAQHAGKVVIENFRKSPAFKKFKGFRRLIRSEEERYAVTVPPERLDVRLSVDLVEEVGRLNGYDKIPSKVLSPIGRPKPNPSFLLEFEIRRLLIELGYSEIYTHPWGEKGEVELENPLIKPKKFLRPNLRDSLKEALEKNLRNGPLLRSGEIKIFEVGVVFFRDGERLTCAVGWGSVRTEGEEEQARVELEKVENALSEALGAAISGEIRGSVLEFDVSALLPRVSRLGEDLSWLRRGEVRFTPFSPYPFIVRDIAVFLPKGADAEELHKLLSKEAGELAWSIYQFDTFEKGEEVSYAYRIVFQSMERTLTDAEVNKVMERVCAKVQKAGGRVR